MQPLRVRFLLAVLLSITAAAFAEGPPRMSTVAPDTGKAGAEFVATGENLAKANVAELFLTDGKTDIAVAITTQEAASIKFKAPATVKAGAYRLMILTGDRKQLIEQPVKVTIE